MIDDRLLTETIRDRVRPLPRRAAALAPGSVLAGRYRIVRRLGAGGMGVVYEAEDQRLGLTIAIKVVRMGPAHDPVLQGRFRQEVLAGRRISHPGVVRIHDLEQDGELSFLTMDLVAGRTLSEVLEEQGRLPLERALPIQRQLAAALSAAHRMGVVHRDLKPSNILLDEDGDAHITDFGIARTLASTGLTDTGEVMGTPEYLAPEQAEGGPVDHRADIYALGLIFFQMLAGEPAFPGHHVGERLARRLASRPRRLAETGVQVPDYLENVVAKCVRRDPAKRYQTADDLSADLEARRSPTMRWRPTRQQAAVVGSLLVVATALASLAGFALRSPARNPGLLTEPDQGPATGVATQASSLVPAPRHEIAVLPPAGVEADAAGPVAWLSAALPEMLTSSLSESPDLRVVDSLRMARTLRDLRLPAGRLPESELLLVAELLDVDRVVVPRIWAVGDSVHAELRLIDPATPRALTPVVREDASGPDVLRLPERLSERLRQRFRGQPPRHPRATAVSSAALTAYARGLESLGQGDTLGALPWLRKAVEEDPTFTDAWVSLARTHQSLGQRSQALEAAGKAVEQSAGEAGRTGFEARARLASLQGESQRAQKLLEELVAGYPHDAEARLLLAEAYGEAGEYLRADRILEAVVRDDPNHPRAWYLRGKYSILAGSPERAVDDFLVRALVVHNRLDNDQGRAQVLNALGAAHQKLGELDRAEQRYLEAVEIRRKIGDYRGASATLSNLADLEQLQGRFDEARTHLEEGLSLCLELGYREGTADFENSLGMLEERRGQYPRALDHYRKALSLRRQLGKRHILAESHGNVGFAYFILGEYDDAGLHWREALALHRQTENRVGEAQTLQLVAQLAMAQGRWEEALATNLEVLELARERNLPQLEALATAHLGRVAQLRGRYGAALSSYREAMELFAGYEDLRGWTEITLYEADALIEIDSQEQAMAKLAQVDPWIDSTGHRDHRAERWRLEAEIELRRGRLTRVRELVARAREEAQAGGALVIQLFVELTASRLDLAAGEPERAAGILRPLLQTAERLDHAALRTEAGAVLAEAEWAAGRPEEAETTLRDALAVTYDRPPMAVAAHLHRLLAELLAARGAADPAREERQRAQRELERLGEDLEPDQQASLDRRLSSTLVPRPATRR